MLQARSRRLRSCGGGVRTAGRGSWRAKDTIATAQSELDHFLSPAPNAKGKPKLPPIVGFDAVSTSIETAKRRIQDDTRARIDFHTFSSSLLLDAEA